MQEGIETQERHRSVETESAPEQYEETIRSFEQPDSAWPPLERFAKQ